MSRANRRGPSINDVARAAGVSGQTVSRVASGLDNVQAETRRRVEQAMQDLGYLPNRAARALRSGRFGSVGVIVFTLSSFGNMHTIEAVTNAAAAAGYSVTLISAERRTEADLSKAFARLEDQAVDGMVLLIESHLVDETEIELPPGLPAVLVDSAGRSQRPRVDTDQAQGARLATQHLLDLGHATVWHLAGPTGSYAAERREAAWRETLRAAGRSIPRVLRGDWTAESGYRLGRRIAERDDVSAAFVANDQMALGLLRACHEIGRAIPGTLSVVGFDDMLESAEFWPPLTTVHQHFDEVGRTAVATLLAAIDGAPTSPNALVPTTLVIRNSAAPPPPPDSPAPHLHVPARLDSRPRASTPL